MVSQIRIRRTWLSALYIMSLIVFSGMVIAEDLPPIECPLRKAGIDKTKLRPFEEVEKYVKFLERPDRAKWQKPEAVVENLGLTGTETVVDLGSGSGYFTFRLSKAVPNGEVFAIDSQPEMVRHVHRKVLTGDWPNVRTQFGKPDDPGLPPDADLVFVCDVLLHVRQKAEWLKTLHSQMRSGAKLVLIDFREGELPEGPPEEIKVPKKEVARLCREAGFVLKEDRSDLLPYQEFLVFEKP
jgi:SAM-dependent methyltransferase